MTYHPWLSYAYSPIAIIRSNSVEVRGRPWSHTMSKQPNVELPIVSAEHSLGKSTAVKRKRGRPKKQTEASFDRSAELPDMCEVHGLGKSSESTTVKRKRGRPNKQTESSFGRSEELPDMCAEHGLGKISDVERKRIRLGEVLTLQQLLTKGVGWFTIKPSVAIVALGRRRYSYHRCVECGKKGLQDAEGKYGCVEHPEADTKQTYRLRVLLRQGDLNMWITAFDKVAESILGVSVKKISALDDDGRKRVAWGVSGMNCYMTVEKTQGTYTNYTKSNQIRFI